jgi:O-antigen/teichoic acid export membrane protein
MTGTTIAQAIPIAISPILTRIYTPEDFGVFALYMSIASTIAVIATGRYEFAIMLPKKDDDAINIVVLSLLIAFIISFMIFIIIFFLKEQIIIFLNNPELSDWLYFIPLTVLLTGFYQSFSFWSNRQKKYKRLALSKVSQSSAIAITNIGMGLNGFGTNGLILGGVFGQFIAIGVLVKSIWNINNLIYKKVNKLKLIVLAKKYIDFPKINMPHAFLNVFSTNIVVILLSYFFQNAVTGFYALANRVIVSPMSIITGSYGQVFFQKITELSNANNKHEEIMFFKKTVIKLLLFSFPVFFLFFLFSTQIFSFIFGEKWEIAGYYAKILIPMLYLRFTGSIVSSIVIVHNQQKKALIIEVINTILRVLSLVIGGVMQNIVLGLILFSLTSFLITLYRLNWYTKIVTVQTP